MAEALATEVALDRCELAWDAAEESADEAADEIELAADPALEEIEAATEEAEAETDPAALVADATPDAVAESAHAGLASVPNASETYGTYKRRTASTGGQGRLADPAQCSLIGGRLQRRLGRPGSCTRKRDPCWMRLITSKQIGIQEMGS